MPITYHVQKDGHFVHAVASGTITSDEFVEYEVTHALDDRIKPPFSELFEIKYGACRQITMDDMSKVLVRRSEIERLSPPHRCALVVSPGNTHAWNLAKFYEGMVMLHSPETVIVFGDLRTAKVWLGVENRKPNKPDSGNVL
jgi:hypothetical protein